MIRAQRLLSPVAASVLAVLAACAGSPDTASMGAAEPVCRAAGAEALLGRQLNEMVLAEALRASGGLRTRVIPPGGVVTLDHDPMRLNIELDAAGTIRRMRCG
ncbi:MAG: I78 family peptidase inhibitor [Ramlibacter sp.]